MMSKEDIKNEITYKFLEESELPGISKLIAGMKKASDQVLYLRDNSMDYYHWIYFQNPAGNAIIASAWHKDEIISTFAMAPKRMHIGGKEVMVGKTMDMFTNPEYQGLGIISKLTKMVFEESIIKKLNAWYVTPSGNSYPIFKDRWGYNEPFEIHFKYRIIDIDLMAKTIALPGLKKKLFKIAALIVRPFFSYKKAGKSKCIISRIYSFSQDFDKFWNSISGDYGNILIKDSAYLNWRYVKNPDEYEIYAASIDGGIAGYIVTKKTIRKGVPTGEIVDILFRKNDSETGIVLIKTAQKHLYESGCAICETWDFNNSLLSGIYRKAGLGAKRAIVKFLLSPNAVYPDFYDKSKWHLTQSDGNDI